MGGMPSMGGLSNRLYPVAGFGKKHGKLRKARSTSANGDRSICKNTHEKVILKL